MYNLNIASRSSTITAEYAQESLNLEFITNSDSVQNLLGLFRNVIPSIQRKLGDTLANFHPEDEKTTEVNDLTRKVGENRQQLTTIGMVTYGRTLMPIPEGLANNVRMIKYLEYLIDVSDTFGKGVNEILSEYKIVLSTFLSNKEAKRSVKDRTDFYRAIAKKRLELEKQIGAFFSPDLNRARLPLEAIYDQGRDVVQAAELANKLHKARQRADLPAVKKATDHCANLLGMIIEQSEKGSIDSISGAAAVDLANGAMEVARWVELLSLYHFRTDQAITTVTQQVEVAVRLKD